MLVIQNPPFACRLLIPGRYHIISNHSPRANAVGIQIDFLGILLLMWGATMPSVFYGFYDNQRLQIIYWTVVSNILRFGRNISSHVHTQCSTLALACAIATFQPIFRTPTFRVYRAAMFAMFGLSGIGFITHAIFKYGLETANNRMSLNWMLLMAFCNLFGAAMYATRVS